MIKPVSTLLLALLPLGAVGAEPAHIDACALLDSAQIERVIGQSVEAGVRRDAGLESNGAWSSSCLWTLKSERGAASNPSAPLGGRRFVILNAMQWPAGSGRAHEFLDSFREAAEAGVIARAPSPRPFGDEALWWGDGLAVRKHDTSFGLSIYLPGTPQKAAGLWEEQLAPLVLNQIERHHTALMKH